MINIAQKILDKYYKIDDYTVALVVAKRQAITTKRDNYKQTSYFLFDDNSRLRICESDHSMGCLYICNNT